MLLASGYARSVASAAVLPTLLVVVCVCVCVRAPFTVAIRRGCPPSHVPRRADYVCSWRCVWGVDVP
eukprot:6755103-Prymnesium_polylepis.2